MSSEDGDGEDVVIDCRHLCFEYPAEYGCPAQRVLNGVNLRLRRSRTLGLLGMNECGKTTLARVLLGRRQATSGSVRVFGEALEAVGRAPRWARDARLFLVVYTLAGLLIAQHGQKEVVGGARREPGVDEGAPRRNIGREREPLEVDVAREKGREQVGRHCVGQKI